MQEDNLAPRSIAQQDFFDKTFIFSPKDFRIKNGNLEYLNTSESNQNKLWGYVLIIVAIAFLLYSLYSTHGNVVGIVVSLLGAAFLGGVGFVIAKGDRKENSLKKSGKVIVGRLESIEGKWFEHYYRGKLNKVYRIIANYKFVNPQGRTISGVKVEDRDDLKEKSLPDPGTAILVVYNNDKEYEAC